MCRWLAYSGSPILLDDNTANRSPTASTYSRNDAICAGSHTACSRPTAGEALGRASMRPNAGFTAISPRRCAADSAARSVRR